MITDVVFNPGYTAETTYTTLRVTHDTGFETVEAFVTAFSEVLNSVLPDEELHKLETGVDLFNFYFTAVLDDMPWELSSKLESEGWIVGDFNNKFQPPDAFIYNAYRAIESQTGYYIFTPEGDRYVS
jgi:hypothetical protein